MVKSSFSMYLPTRSISLPTRLIHPKAQRVQEKLKNIQDLNSSPSTSSRIQLGLAKLVELYDFVNEQIICSPQGQQALCLSHNAKLVEQAFDESILLLDVTYATRDLIETFLEQIQELQSTLRRRGRDLSIVESEIHTFFFDNPGVLILTEVSSDYFQERCSPHVNSAVAEVRTQEAELTAVSPLPPELEAPVEIHTYINFSKKIKNLAKRQLLSLGRKQTKKKSQVIKLDQHSSTLSNILRQSHTSTISIFESLLKFLSSLGDTYKKNVEFGCVDKTMIFSFYGRIISKKIVKDIDVQTMLGRLAMLNAGLEVINDELNYLSRRLIQHRVSLLNIVTS